MTEYDYKILKELELERALNREANSKLRYIEEKIKSKELVDIKEIERFFKLNTWSDQYSIAQNMNNEIHEMLGTNPNRLKEASDDLDKNSP